MSSNLEFYFDYNSTAPVAEGIHAFLRPLLTTEFGNPSSKTSELGQRAAETIALAREHVSNFISAHPDEIVFLSGGTESCFAALTGALRARPDRKHIIVSAVEHSAVTEAAQFLVEIAGVEVTSIPVDQNGEMDLEQLRREIRPDTNIISVMLANNETGVIYPLREIVNIAREHGVLVHTDAVQGAAYLPIDFLETGVDLLSLSAHKFGGIKGSGALVVRDGIAWQGVIRGGGQELGRRGGTESVPLIAAMGEAARVRRRQIYDGAIDRLRAVRDFFEDTLHERMSDISVNGRRAARLPNTSSVCFSGVVAQDLISVLGKRGIIVSAGAACKANSIEPSHVLRAMGLSTVDCLSSVRFSFGVDTTRETVLHLVDILCETVAYFRAEAQSQLLANFRG